MSGKFLLIYICNFHVLSHLLLIYICKLHWIWQGKPIGSASVAQVHEAIWKPTGEKVAVKVQYPDAERLMIGDLKNLRALAEFLQRTEFKFDLLSSIKELQRQITNEFDFRLEARNMDYMRQGNLLMIYI